MKRIALGKLTALAATAPWAEIKCDACATVGIKVVAFVVVPDEAEWELHYCRPCAVLAGWPWLRSANDRPVISEQRSEGVHG